MRAEADKESEQMKIKVEHFPDRKRPCIVLAEGNQCVVIGYLTDRTREKMLRKACGRSMPENCVLGIALPDCKYTLSQLLDLISEVEE